jgi:radical SAM superfamily enzyme YgiQ (UPF0313 family)
MLSIYANKGQGLCSFYLDVSAIPDVFFFPCVPSLEDLSYSDVPMRLHIIAPTHFANPFSSQPYKAKKRDLIPLTLPYLAALIPKGIDLVLTDEQTQSLDFNRPCDCVFLSVMILTSLRAYEIADVYRRKGIPVIMGGPHCYFYCEEILEHADAVAVGEGETLIPKILSDLAHGRLDRIYRADSLHDLCNLPFPRHDLLDPRIFSRFHTVAVQTSRGCPHSCEFCAERYYLGERYRTRPVDEVIEEIRFTKSRQIFFADSTFAGNRSRTMELMEKLVPLKIRWSTLWNTHRVLDKEFMLLAKRSGLLHLNMGVESIKQETLDGMNKKTTKADQLEQVVRILRDLDISFSFNLIFGWDTDHTEDFSSTLSFLRKNKVHVAFFNVFTPHKGTRIYDRFLAEARLRDLKNMGRWPGVIAEINPKNFSAEELEGGIIGMYKEFYSWPSILRRLPFPKSKASLASWFMNLSQRKMLSGESFRTDFDGY